MIASQINLPVKLLSSQHSNRQIVHKHGLWIAPRSKHPLNIALDGPKIFNIISVTTACEGTF